MKVFLTGATGYLGGAVVRALTAANHEVHALVRAPEAAGELGRAGVVLVPGALEEPGSWQEALVGVDAVVHTAALVAAWGPPPEHFDRINLHASTALLDACAAAGVGRRLVAGSLFALGPSPDGTPRDEAAVTEAASPLSRANDYVRSKTALKEALTARQAAGEGVIQVFPTILLGPGARTAGNHTATVLDDLRRGRLPGLIGDGRQVWNLVGVEDAAQGIRLALEGGRPGRNYILGGEDWTQERFVREGAAALGVDAPRRRIDTRLLIALAAAAEAGARITGREPPLTRGAVRLYDSHWAFSSERARAELGYAPRPVAQRLRETVDWLGNNA